MNKTKAIFETQLASMSIGEHSVMYNFNCMIVGLI